MTSTLLRWLILTEVLFASTVTAYGQVVYRIDSNFVLEDFDRNGDGYKLTIRNDSENAFSNFLVVILGTDISGITVFQREIPVDFMEGKSERSFFVPGYDERIFEVKMRILAPDVDTLLR